VSSRKKIVFTWTTTAWISDHNGEKHKGQAGVSENPPYPAGNIRVLAFYDLRRKSTEAMYEMPEHPQKPLRKRRDTRGINCHQQAEVEERTGKHQYGGYVIQQHTVILSF
jgi:hypothetical protein